MNSQRYPKRHIWISQLPLLCYFINAREWNLHLFSNQFKSNCIPPARCVVKTHQLLDRGWQQRQHSCKFSNLATKANFRCLCTLFQAVYFHTFGRCLMPGRWGDALRGSKSLGSGRGRCKGSVLRKMMRRKSCGRELISVCSIKSMCPGAEAPD